MSPSRIRTQLAVPTTFFFVFFGLASVQLFVVPYLHRDHGLSDLAASSVMATLYFVFAIARFFTGHVIRRIGKKPTIVLGVCGYVGFPLLLAVGTRPAVFFAAAAVIGIGAALLWTASSAQVLDSSGEKRYGLASGILYFFTKSGIAMGTWFYSWLIVADLPRLRRIAALCIRPFLPQCDLSPGSYPFVLIAATAFGAVALLSTCFIPSTRVTTVVPSFKAMMRLITARRNFFAPFTLMFSFVVYGLMLTMTNQVVEATLGKAYIGPVHSCYLTSGVALTFVAGAASDFIGRKRLLAICFGCGAVGLFLLSMAKTPTAFMTAAVLLGAPFGGVPAVAMAWVGDNSTPENRPSVHAYVFAWRDFGFVAVVYIRLLMTRLQISYGRCFLVFAVIFAAMCAWMIAASASERRLHPPQP